MKFDSSNRNMTKNNQAIIDAVAVGYTITTCGKVSSKKRLLNPWLNNMGYLVFAFRPLNGDAKRNIGVHKFQAYKKFGNAMFAAGMVVRHLNGNPTDNSWANIEIGTMKDNMADRPAHERHAHALKASIHNRRFSDADILKIREFYNNCKSYKKTMEEFNINSKGSLHWMLNADYQTKK